MPKVSSKGKTSGAGADGEKISAIDLNHSFFADEFTYNDLLGFTIALLGTTKSLSKFEVLI